ncbi:MAG TPA: hypothetical protein EYQ86_09105 [Bacteroidetes bacterium]|nr:hypothetical protein [Bacteroidota bacterium]
MKYILVVLFFNMSMLYSQTCCNTDAPIIYLDEHRPMMGKIGNVRTFGRKFKLTKEELVKVKNIRFHPLHNSCFTVTSFTWVCIPYGRDAIVVRENSNSFSKKYHYILSRLKPRSTIYLKEIIALDCDSNEIKLGTAGITIKK